MKYPWESGGNDTIAMRDRVFVPQELKVERMALFADPGSLYGIFVAIWRESLTFARKSRKAFSIRLSIYDICMNIKSNTIYNAIYSLMKQKQ